MLTGDCRRNDLTAVQVHRLSPDTAGSQVQCHAIASHKCSLVPAAALSQTTYSDLPVAGIPSNRRTERFIFSAIRSRPITTRRPSGTGPVGCSCLLYTSPSPRDGLL